MKYSARIVMFYMVAMASIGFLSGCREANGAQAQQGKIVFAVNSDGGGHTCQIPFEDGKKSL